MKVGNESVSKHPFYGLGAAILAAVLFGATTPFAKILVGDVQPLMLAGVLYLSSGLGLTLARLFTPRRNDTSPIISKQDFPWLLGAIVFGGALGPALLMFGLASTQASTSSLLLNLEGVFSALLAWVFFKENCDKRIVAGMLAISAGGVVLSFTPGSGIALSTGCLLVVLACLAWAIDNNFTRNIHATQPMVIAQTKGLCAGAVNLGLALWLGNALPTVPQLLSASVVGFLGYGTSLVLFVIGLRHLGTSRTGAYFSTAPFVGAAISIALLGEAVSSLFFVAAALMGVGVWLHLTEVHDHEHHHEALSHEHEHIHDQHHDHEHGPNDPPGEPHSHWHEHKELTHSHAHYPDIHHRHPH